MPFSKLQEMKKAKPSKSITGNKTIYSGNLNQEPNIIDDSKINQENRIKLMLSVAKEKLNPKPDEHKFEIVNAVDDNNETLNKETANV